MAKIIDDETIENVCILAKLSLSDEAKEKMCIRDRYFTGTVSRVGGITLEDIEDNVEKLHSEAFDPLGLDTDLTLDSVCLLYTSPPVLPL